jgi:hypothetical protein
MVQVVKWDFWAAMGFSAIQYLCSVLSPLVLKEMIGWLGADCHPYDSSTATLNTNVTCVCRLAADCIRDQQFAGKTVADYPLWMSYGVIMAFVLFGLNFVQAIAQGQEMHVNHPLGACC